MYKITVVAALLILTLTSCKTQPKTIVILGNSITVHEPSEALGWTHNWGMAASSRDSDYVHLLIDSIHAHYPTAIIKFKAIGDFERDYAHYNLASLDSLKNPYLLIMRIAENVDHQDTLKKGFMTAYDRLIKYLAPQKTIVTDGFWANVYPNAAIAKYAEENKLPFVKLSDLAVDTTNMAYGKFVNYGVQQHPSDKGMRKISQRLWIAIEPVIK